MKWYHQQLMLGSSDKHDEDEVQEAGEGSGKGELGKLHLIQD